MSRKYRATVIDNHKVPTHHKDVCIRPVDTRLIEEMATIVDGDLHIDGVEITKRKENKDANN